MLNFGLCVSHCRIQGKVESLRRNYGKIIEELHTHMTGPFPQPLAIPPSPDD